MYNIHEDPMRDTSTSYETGWLRNGEYYRDYGDLSTGLAGLGEDERKTVRELPTVGQKEIQYALADPEARPIVARLLQSSNPQEALGKQAEQDLAEAVQSTGKVIVFKHLARVLVPKMRAAEAAVMAAAPNHDTPYAAIARDIIETNEDPEPILKEFYEAVAMEAVAPEALVEEREVWEDEDAGLLGLGDLGKGWSRKKKIRKSFTRGPSAFMGKKGRKMYRRVRKISAIVVGSAAVAAGLVFAAPAIIGALGTAVSAIGSVGGSVFGAVGGLASSMFGGGKKGGGGGGVVTTYEGGGAAVPGMETTYGGAAPSGGVPGMQTQYPSGGGGGGVPGMETQYPSEGREPVATVDPRFQEQPSAPSEEARREEQPLTYMPPTVPIYPPATPPPTKPGDKPINWGSALAGIAGFAVKAYAAAKGGAPQQTVQQQREAGITKLISQGYTREQATQIVDHAIQQVQSHDAATGGQGVPAASPGEIKGMEAGMLGGIPMPLILIGVGLLVMLAKPASGGGSRRRYRRNTKKKRR